MIQEDIRWNLSPAEEAAAQRFIEALRQKYPELAEGAEYGRGHEGTVYVYANLPEDEDEEIEVHEAVAEISTNVLVETDVMVLLMKAMPSHSVEP
jgi:plasmid stabilization system protein ParE